MFILGPNNHGDFRRTLGCAEILTTVLLLGVAVVKFKITVFVKQNHWLRVAWSGDQGDNLEGHSKPSQSV